MDRLSYTQFNLYCDCPFKWKLTYIDKIKEPSKPVFRRGTLIHKYLETGMMTSLTDAEWKELNDITYDKSAASLPKVYAKVNEILQGLETVGRELEVEDIFVEKYGGYIDHLLKDNCGYYYIVDYKITKSPKGLQEIFSDGQLLLYSRLYELFNKVRLKVGYINIVPPADYMGEFYVRFSGWYEVTSSDIQAMQERLERFKKDREQNIADGVFPKCGKWCRTCWHKSKGYCNGKH